MVALQLAEVARTKAGGLGTVPAEDLVALLQALVFLGVRPGNAVLGAIMVRQGQGPGEAISGRCSPQVSATASAEQLAIICLADVQPHRLVLTFNSCIVAIACFTVSHAGQTGGTARPQPGHHPGQPGQPGGQASHAMAAGF